MNAASRSRRAGATTLESAAELHRTGRLTDAATAYQALLSRDADDFQARYLLGLLCSQQGQFEAAIDHIERALAQRPELADAWYHLGDAQARLQRWNDAQRSFERAAASNPGDPLSRFRLGLLAEGLELWKVAVRWYREALELQPDNADVLNNLGHVLARLGQTHEAEALFRRACAQRADFPAPRINLGLLLERRGDLADALAIYDEGLAHNPEDPELNFLSGVLLAASGDSVAAAERYGQALTTAPTHGRAWNNLGVLYLEQGFGAEARTCFERAIEGEPDLADAWSNLGNARLSAGDAASARASFERAVALRPAFAEALNGLGTALWEAADLDGAKQRYEQALASNPELAEAAANLAAVHQRFGALADADRWYARALALQPSVALRIRRATMLPPIMGTEAEIAADRDRLAAELAALAAAPGQADENELLKYPDTMFYVAFHGENNRALMSRLGEIHRQTCPALTYRAPHVDRRRVGKRVRVAFVSQNLYRHSVGYSFAELIRGLASDPRLEVAGVSLGTRHDALTERIRERCVAWVDARGSLAQMRADIESLEADVLVYTDIGMDTRSHLLAHARLARVQCVSGGHPETTGIAAIDHFLSSRRLEEASAQARYSENLVRLEAYNTVLMAPSVPADLPTRAELGWPAGRRVYLCPVKLQKLHPRFDRVLGALLRADPDGAVVLFEDESYGHWRTLTERRQAATIPDVRERVVFAPWADARTFAAALVHAEAVLDPTPFGLGTTAFIAFRLGVPVVTWPSDTLAGRGVRACLVQMDLPWAIADSAEEFVDKALTLAREPDLRRSLSQELLARVDILFGDTACVGELADFFVSRTEEESNR